MILARRRLLARLGVSRTAPRTSLRPAGLRQDGFRRAFRSPIRSSRDLQLRRACRNRRLRRTSDGGARRRIARRRGHRAHPIGAARDRSRRSRLDSGAARVLEAPSRARAVDSRKRRHYRRAAQRACAHRRSPGCASGRARAASKFATAPAARRRALLGAASSTHAVARRLAARRRRSGGHLPGHRSRRTDDRSHRPFGRRVADRTAVAGTHRALRSRPRRTARPARHDTDRSARVSRQRGALGANARR